MNAIKTVDPRRCGLKGWFLNVGVLGAYEVTHLRDILGKMFAA